MWRSKTHAATRINMRTIKLETGAKLVSLGGLSNTELGPRSGEESTSRGNRTVRP